MKSRSNSYLRLAQLDRQNVWHPFTQHTEWDTREPFIVESAKGMWLKDVQGHRMLDGVSSLWVNVWGHREPEIDRAIRDQLGKVAHATFLGLTHEPAILLARELIRLAPRGLTRVFYSDNGSTAVEVALKMAYQYWQLKGFAQKRKFLSLREGYHGDTLGSVAVGGVDLFHQRFEHLLFSGFRVSAQNAKEAVRLLEQYHHEIAAMVVEPMVQGASGMLMMPPGYLTTVARACKKYNVLLIADEVATGFGRTGKMFAVEHERVQPDLMCVAKSITGGYLPLAATLATEDIYRAFLGCYDEFKTFFHGHTYTANPLACAAAIANLRLYRERRLLQHIRQRARQLTAGLADLKKNPSIKEVRQKGMMVGIELRSPVADPGSRWGLRVCDAALKRGVWLRPLGDIVVVMPPLAISEKELAFLIKVLHEAINDVFTS